MSITINTDTKELNFKKVDFDPFNGLEILKVIQTTESQLEIWLSCIIGGNDANRSYNESVSLFLNGKLNIQAMTFSLQELIKRHELLRSTISSDGKSIFIYEYLPLTIDYQDLSESSQEEKDEYISKIQKADAEKAFHLKKGPLFRTYLIKLSENEFFLKLSAHHIICDGWSLGIILENVSKIYSAKISNTSPSLDVVIPFSQYSKELLIYSKSVEYQKDENYWLNQYKNAPPILNIPTDNPRPTTRTFKSQRLDFPISTELIEQVKSMGAKSGASLVSTFIAAFETYLYILTKQSTIILGLPTAGQSATGNYELIGHCVNILPLKSSHKQDISFVEYLRKRKSEILEAYDHQQLTFGTLLKRINIPRDSSRIPLIPVVFNIDMGMDANVEFSGLTHTLSSDPRSYENFEIFLNITEKKHVLIFEWSYNTHLFNASTIKRMMNEFLILLKNVVVNPEIKVKNIFQSTNSTKQFNIWNNTFSEYPKNKITTEFINEAAIRTPNKTAIYFKESELSYSQLNQQSNQLANYLIKSGVQKGDIVGLLVDRSPEMIIALLAIMKSGAAYLPLDPKYPKGRVEFMLSDSSAKYLISSEKYGRKLSTQANQIFIEKIWPNINEYSNQYPTLNINGYELAYILYTSGSTGKPKGVQIEHHSLTNLLLSVQKEPGITTEDILLAVTTISFDIAGTELFLPLITGASIYLVDSETAKDGRELLQLVQKKKISIMQATPVTWRMMLAAGWTKQLSLKIICTGEAFPKDLAENLINKGVEIWNGYGPSETTIWSSIKKITKDDNLITIGKPIANTQIYILDENQNPVLDGTSGELYIAGDGLARSYLNRPELTAEKFISNPFNKNKTKMYRTGDLGYFLENGEIVCLGRVDAQVKIRGHRIELGEIEYSLSQQKGVKEAIVIAYEDNTNDHQSLLAYIVPDENIESDKDYFIAKNKTINILNVPKQQIQTWKNALKEQLPDYMIPAFYVVVSHLPTTSNGKVDRKSLPKLDILKAIEFENSFIAPRDEHETLIFNIWSKHLSLDSISINSNFFEIGGHSLIAIRVMIDLEKETGIKLPISTLFESSTIEKLAQILKSSTANDKKKIKWESLVPIKKTGNKTPIYIVHGIGLNVLRFERLKKYMDPNQPIYAIQGIGLNGNINGLPNTIEEIAQHYNSEILEYDPIGPYILAGYSSGGLLAFEMAKQLLMLGKEIKLLAMIDTCTNNENVENQISTAFKSNLLKIIFYGKSYLKYPKETFKHHLNSLKWRLKDTYLAIKPKEEESYNSVSDIYYSVYYNSKQDPLNIKVDLLKCQERVYFLNDSEKYGWSKYALKGVNVHDIPGNHHTCFSEPNVKILAETLQNLINKNT